MPNIVASSYEILRLLDSGGVGLIYLGRHLRLEKNVVLKVDKRELSGHALKSLRQEVETLKNLSHTYIPQVYDFVLEDGLIYTVMDYIEGESLDKALKRGERFTPQQVVEWAKQILDALVYLHNCPPYGILHSDIKPANLMVTPQGDIRLIDFNVALALKEDGAVSVGRSRGYASPEHYGMEYPASGASVKSQSRHVAKMTTLSDADTVVTSSDVHTVFSAMDGASSDKRSWASASTGGSKKTIILDARSDVYGLGATLYHLLTGRRPAGNALEVVPLTSEDCPIGLAAIINKALSLDRNLRFQTAEDMLTAFENIHRNDPRARSHRRFRRVAAAALAAVLAVGSVTTFVGLKRMQCAEEVAALVEASQNAYLKGDITEAVRLALGAASFKSGLLTPQVPASAAKTLADVLGVYDVSDGFKLHKTHTLPSAPLMAVLSQDGKTAAIAYAYEAAIVDLESGKSMFKLPLASSALAEVRFLNSETIICAGRDGLSAYEISSGMQLWSGSPATAIAVSADGGTIAAINRDNDFAAIYNADGSAGKEISLGGRRQYIAANDAFANPRDKVFALSAKGRYMAVSFEDGSFSVFDTSTSEELLNLSQHDDTGYVCYEGGFSGELLAFSATSGRGSDFIVFDMDNIDIENPEAMGSFESASRFGVIADENGIIISYENKVVRLDPVSGSQRELAWVESDVKGFAIGGGYTLISQEGSCVFFDKNGSFISRHERDYISDIALISDDYAMIGGRDMLDLTIFRLDSHAGARIFSYDASYKYHEARVCADGKRFMLFSAEGFRLYDGDNMIHEQLIPDSGLVYDQQYSESSGNLAVIYRDALTIYSGRDGRTVFEEKDLCSVFYSSYGISVLDTSGRLRLIDIDSGTVVDTADAGKGETFAAFCGVTVNGSFLNGRKLIGAAKAADGYYFAISDGVSGTVYDGNGKRQFEFPVNSEAEAFFTETAVVISPMHGSPVVYSLKSGKRIANLEKDAYLTYITQAGDHIVSQYLSTDGKHFGVLLDSSFQSIASLPDLCGVWGEQLVFDRPQGELRKSHIYTLIELISMATSEPAEC